MKDKALTAGVDRDEVRRGAELIGLDWDIHIANVIAALREISAVFMNAPQGGDRMCLFVSGRIASLCALCPDRVQYVQSG